MQDVYIKLGVVLISAAIGIYIMDRAHKEKVRKAQLEFERMMKAHGLSLEVIDDKESK